MWLVGCPSNNPPAPISQVNRGAAPPVRSGMLITPPPTDRSPTVAPSPGVREVKKATPNQKQPLTQQPVATVHSKPQPFITPASSKPVVQTINGKIVYNRKYDDIPKGSYAGGSHYTVKHGDTLFYIAWVTGNDFRDLAQRNNISEPYDLQVGQVIQVGNPSAQSITADNTTTQKNRDVPVIADSIQKSAAVVAQQPIITYSESSGKQNDNNMFTKGESATTATTVSPVAAPTASRPQPTASSVSTSVPITGWRWPTEGKIIENFSGTEGGNKGIDIVGRKGQSITATADGRVVYAGNALRGYGNLIIIKHNDDYLSAYAHNDTMLVREQQEVKAGQKIATMGSTGTSSTRLHFEIRYKGKSVNPLQYLPQR
ncbi:murein hydrolase activator NlpD [Enterobacteriaceae bacterium ESL0689]|nr:murein hydrolase activator NlpD [Enterobacteriaceae bacterium ESL0689]